LKESGLLILKYYSKNDFFIILQLFLINEEYEFFKNVWPRDERTFKVPYVALDVQDAPYSNIGAPLFL
jgi:hypothetical protein